MKNQKAGPISLADCRFGGQEWPPVAPLLDGNGREHPYDNVAALAHPAMRRTSKSQVRKVKRRCATIIVATTNHPTMNFWCSLAPSLAGDGHHLIRRYERRYERPPTNYAIVEMGFI